MFGYYLYAHASVLTIHCKTSAAIVCLYTYTDFVRFLAYFLLYISNVSIITIQQQLIVSQLIQIFILKHNYQKYRMYIKNIENIQYFFIFRKYHDIFHPCCVIAIGTVLMPVLILL